MLRKKYLVSKISLILFLAFPIKNKKQNLLKAVQRKFIVCTPRKKMLSSLPKVCDIYLIFFNFKISISIFKLEILGKFSIDINGFAKNK